MAIFRERTDLDKKPTWYLFLAANVTVLLGCAITWVLFHNYFEGNITRNVLLIPTLVCNIVALILVGLFIWLEARGIMNKAMHFRKKWLWWYLSALIIFVVAILYCFIFIFIYNANLEEIDSEIPLIPFFVVTGVLTLVAIGLQRYARFKIDLDMYRRTHGELPKQEEIDKQKESKQKPVDSSSVSSASSGLADSISKQ